MKKETVVRQNRCDNEMNLLLFGSFFLYFAMQLFIGEPTQQEGLVNKLNMLLYLVFVPGFLFRLGYCFGGISRIKEEAQGKKYLGRVALRAYLYFLVLSVGYGVYVSKLPFTYCVNQVITFMDIPAVSAIFFALALAAVLAVVFYNSLKKLSGNKKRMLIFALVLLLGVFLRTKGETYALTAAFFGADTQQAVPVVPYFAYFLFGMWMEEKKAWISVENCRCVCGSYGAFTCPVQNAAAGSVPCDSIRAAGIPYLRAQRRPVRSDSAILRTAFCDGYGRTCFCSVCGGPDCLQKCRTISWRHADESACSGTLCDCGNLCGDYSVLVFCKAV